MAEIPSGKLPAEFQQDLTHFCVDHSGEALFCTDQNGTLVYANAAASRSLGYTRDALLTKKIFDFSPELTPELWIELWKEIRQRGSFDFEFVHRAQDGRRFPVEINAVHAALGSSNFLCAFFHDVQERKRLQQLKDEFVSTVSHELRTPMTIIREGVAQVLEGIRGDINDGQRRALSIAVMGIDRLARMINDLLDVSKIESGKIMLNRQWSDLSTVVREVCAVFTDRLREKGLDLRTRFPPEPIELYVDRDKITRLLTNLIANAVKFTPAGGITVSIERVDAGVACRVADTGVGIAAENLSKIFNKFEQFGRVPDTPDKGTGLGLSISKGIVELHHGTLSVQSELNKGSTFTFILPAHSPEEVFRRQLKNFLADNQTTTASLSVVVFRFAEQTTLIRILEQLIRVPMGRPAEQLAVDTDVIFLALPSTVKKEALRMAQRLQDEFEKALIAEGVRDRIPLAVQVVSLPEDAHDPAAFLDRVFAPPPR